MKKRRIYTNTLINHPARIELGLTLNAYAVADMIYQIANNPIPRRALASPRSPSTPPPPTPSLPPPSRAS